MLDLKNFYKRHKIFVMYALVGTATTFVNLVSYYGLVLTVLNAKNAIQLQLANFISWFLSVFVAYVVNRKYVFKSKNTNIFIEGAEFIGSRAITLLIDMALMFVTVTMFHLNDKLSKLAIQVVVIAVNYYFGKCVIFAKKDK